MGRVRFLTVLMVSSALVLSAASAQAGTFNRPDILDVFDGTTHLYAGDNDTRVAAFMRADASDEDVSGYMWANGKDANNRVFVYADVYQPDKVSRNHRRAKIDQKRYTWLQVVLATATYYSPVAFHSGAMEDCKSSVRADDRDRDETFDLTPTSDDRIRAKLRCHKDVLGDLGFGPNEIEAIENIIGNRVKLNIRLPR